MYLGIEIGGTKLQIGLFDDRLRLKELTRLPVERRGGRAGILRQLENALSERRLVKAVGVGFGGPVDSERGRVVKSFQVSGWSGYPLQEWFEKKLGVPARVENDTKCATLAEARLGAGRGARVVFYSNIGTGIGGGLTVNGQLYSGRYGSMEIGHTRFAMCKSGAARWKRTSQFSVTAEELESLASGLAIERGVSTVEQAAQWYGLAVANAITLLNPDVVVIGGGVSLAGARFWRPFRRAVERFAFPSFRRNFRLRPAALGERVVVVGAALLATERTGLVECAHLR